MFRLATTAGALVASLLASGVARADDPKFEYGKYEAAPEKKVEWKSQASLGLLLTTGNSNAVSFSAAGLISRSDGWNKLQLDVGGAYARSTVLTPSAAAVMAGAIDDPSQIISKATVSTALWNVKLRYDRALSPNNGLYITGFALGNEPAGKKVVAGGQAGYTRQLYKSERQVLVAELGYDFSYERNVTGPVLNYDLHSLRAYAGYDLSFTKDTAFHAGVEYLGNLNKYHGPYGADISSFGDSRVNGNTTLTTRIWKKLAFRLSFTARYDNVPAPLPALGGLPFAAGFLPAAQPLDTITDASLVMTFL